MDERDRKLLELAAKAAGIELWHEAVFVNGLTRKVSQNGVLCWNPLTDDGDALRLAVKLGLIVDTSRPSAGEPFKCHHCGQEDFADPLAATRRAIVRAAAAIGERMA